ncbi:MAG: Eco57I restriction-modification methylase domain-containing protein [Bacteroidales bacterium]|nr:Eco57I restriction-modification methylase domain-containing protein [Bacteroidales bacterium]
MKLKIITPYTATRQNKQTVEKNIINKLQKGINTLLEKLDKDTTAKEEHSERVSIMSFLKTMDYVDTDFAFEEGKIDLAIKANNKFGVLFETKSSLETKDIISHDNLNVKPMHQVIYYYLQQRTAGNNEIKHITVTNAYEWYIFDALDFNRLFYENKKLLKDFKEHQRGAKSSKSTENFYNKIAKPFIENSGAELKAVYFNLKEYTTGKQTKLKALYKLLSSTNLLKKKKQIDSNKLNTKFFKELLYIMGLEEQKEGNKKLIREKAKPKEGSLLEILKTRIEAHKVLDDFKDIEKYGNTYQEQLFGISLDLVLTWINRLLFLKLLEGQLSDYNTDKKGRYKFLNYKRVNNFGILDTLFFEVLNVPFEKRTKNINERYPKLPYLNSSLFEPSELEIKVAFISAMKNNLTLPLHSQTVLTNETVKELPTLDYLLKFLEAYNFASHAEDDIYTEKGELINASVLGLVFEKINGYKEGSFYTPGFITEYMARETIQKAVIQKFNDAYKLDIADFDELRNYTIDKAYKKDKIIEFNKLINSLKIIDPAVGSGHFLVSSLNEILSIKSKLGILADGEGNRLACKIEIENDTAVINDNENKLFLYSLDETGNITEDKNKIQSGIFNEKKTIIENCLFGVDINPNSVKICRLRLWIELLKNSYYKLTVQTKHALSLQLETLPNIDINIKEGNSLISRFPLDADISKALRGSKWNLFTYQNAIQTYKNTNDRKVKRDLVKLIENIKKDFRTELHSQNPTLNKLNKLKNKFYDLFSINMIFEPQEEYGNSNNQENLEKKREAKKKKMEAEINKLNEEIKDLKNNKIYRNALEWRFEFPEVLDDKGNFIGFDVVIGNPPYIRVDDISKNDRAFYTQEYYSPKGKYDIYYLFYERGVDILSYKGNLVFITPNRFTTTDSGQNLRKILLNKFSEIKINSVSKLKVFESAATYPALIFLNSKGEKFDKLWIKESESIQTINYFDKYSSFGKNEVDLFPNLTIPINFKRNILNIYFKIDKTQKLKNVLKIQEGLRINKKYESNIGGNHIVKQYQFHRYSTIIKGTYLKDEILNQAVSVKSDRYINCQKEKILIAEDALQIEATLDINKSICQGGIYFGTLIDSSYKLKSVLAVINSKLLSVLYKNLFSGMHMGGGYLRYRSSFLHELPFIKMAEEEQLKLSLIIDKILKLKKANPQADTTALEAEIDKMVYELYELTEEEIGIVEESVK